MRYSIVLNKKTIGKIEIACYNNNMDNKDQEKAKKDIMIYQWLYIVPFSVIGGVGIIATAVVALFVFICSAKYVVASFMLDSGKIFPALVLTFIGLCVVATLVFSIVLLIKKYIKSIKGFIKEREEILNSDKSQ